MRDRLPDHEPYRAWSNFEFSACLPRELAVRTLRARGSDRKAVHACWYEPIRQVILG